jgi:predicted permease
MRSILQDVRYALRQLRKSPGFTLTAIAVLALGLGANIAVFTILSGIFLRPLPYVQPDRIVNIELTGPLPYYSMSYANILQLRDAVGPGLQIGTSFLSNNASVVGTGGRVQVQQSQVDAGMLKLLGAKPILGRIFRDEEDQPGRGHVVVLSEQAWQKLYASDRNIVGKTLTIRSEAYTILGVMPRGFSFPFSDSVQIWSPRELTPANRTSMSGSDAEFFGSLYARIPDGMNAAQLTAALDRAQALIAKQVPDGDTPSHIKVTGYQQSLTEFARKPLMLLYAVVFGIWALACLNVTSLMLARAVARTREQAVRSALGASRARLLQQTIVESLLLSTLGGVTGLLLGQTAIALLKHQIEKSMYVASAAGAIQMDWRVLLCLAALTLVTAAITGVFPALRAMRRNVRGGLQGVTTTASASQNRTREALVVAQLALTLVFLVGAGLFLRTIHALRQVPLGFSQQNVLTGGVILNGMGKLSNGVAGTQANIVQTSYLPLLEHLHAIPGVQVAALSSVLPMRGEFMVSLSGKLDGKEAPLGKETTAEGRLASAGLVDAMGIPMLRGRFFNADDTASASAVVVVNQAFVNKYLPGQNPVGHTFGMGKGKLKDARIVGVIGDVKQRKVTDATEPEVYFCLAQMEPGQSLYGIATAFMQVAIRAAIPADSLRAQFDKALHEVAPDATTTDVMTIHEAVEDSFGSQTLIAHLLETFAGLALMIASVGLYGLLSFAVAQRTREIGVRLALGAPQANILSLILRRALILVAIGLATGGTLAWFATKLASGYIFGVQAHDGLTFTAVVLVLGAASFLAAWLPARRAAAVDPILALRTE